MNTEMVEPLLTRCRQVCSHRALGLSELRALQDSADLPASVLAELKQPDPAHPYGRKVLLAGEGVEVMVATWTRGMPCVPHDHGGALGVVRVLQGRARHRVWKVEDGALELRKEHVAVAGDLLSCGADFIHSMGDDGADEPLMTLHMYAPTIDFMVVYDETAGQTLVVDGDCGAWIPPRERVRTSHPGMLRRSQLGVA